MPVDQPPEIVQPYIGVVQMPRSVSWAWEPHPDITIYELALILPALVMPNGWKIIENLPPEAKRHFRKGDLIPDNLEPMEWAKLALEKDT